MPESVMLNRAELLRDFVLKSWAPPLTVGETRAHDIAQTSTMLAIAFIKGPDFLGPLTPAQQAAIDSGLALMEQVLLRP